MKSQRIILAFVLSGVINAFAQIPAPTVPSFTFKKLDKRNSPAKILRPANYCFLFFFDTQCDHCQRSIQYISQHYGQFNKTAIYLITLDSAEKIKPFMNKYGISLKDKKKVVILQDTRDEFIQKFRPRRYPALFLYSSRKELVLYEDNEQNLFRFIQQINASGK